MTVSVGANYSSSDVLVGGLSAAEELSGGASSSVAPETFALSAGDEWPDWNDAPIEEYGGALDVDEASLEVIDEELFLNMSGFLPNPCYTLEYEVTELGGDYSIEVYSMVNLRMMRAQVVISFNESIDLGPLSPGLQYTSMESL